MEHKITECRYCGDSVSLMSSEEFYGTNFGTNVYVCDSDKCGAHVGTRKKSGEPLGTLARKELRELRKNCHTLFDALWKEGFMTRDEAYDLLAERMGLPKEQAHIAMFDEKECRRMLVTFQRGRGAYDNFMKGRNVRR